MKEEKRHKLKCINGLIDKGSVDVFVHQFKLNMVNFRSLDAGEHVRFVIRKRPDDNAVTAVIRAESTGKLSEVLLVLLERINHML